MPKPFPREFREDVLRAYRESDSSMAQVAKDFGIAESCLKRWIAIDDQANGALVRDAGPARSRLSLLRRGS